LALGTSLLFFTKGRPTERIWYYDLSDVKVGKKKPFTLERFEEFFKLPPTRGDSERSWTVDLAARRAAAESDVSVYDLKVVNPNAKAVVDTRTRKELLDLIEAKGKEVAEDLAALRELRYDLSTHGSKSLADLPDVEFDLVATMGCGDACPLVRARQREDWSIPDPKHLPPDEFRAIRDLIRQKVGAALAVLGVPPIEADSAGPVSVPSEGHP
jgi:hypothetical protein